MHRPFFKINFLEDAVKLRANFAAAAACTRSGELSFEVRAGGRSSDVSGPIGCECRGMGVCF